MKLQGHRWRKLRTTYRAQAHARNEPCWICGKPIDWNAPPQTTWAFEIDHYLPKTYYPQLAWEISNMRTAHAHCNRKRGDDPASPHMPAQRRWARAVW